MILGVAVYQRGWPQANCGTGLAVLDERAGRFVALGLVPGASGARLHGAAADVTRWAAVANRANGCSIVATNRDSRLLRAVIGVCSGSCRVVVIENARWQAATMPSVPLAERHLPNFVHGACAWILRAHEAAERDLKRLPYDRRPVACAAALVALGAALTVRSARAHLLSEYRVGGSEPKPVEAQEEGAYMQLARLELIADRADPDHERHVRTRAGLLRTSSAREAHAKLRMARSAEPRDPFVNRAVQTLACADIRPDHPQYEHHLSALVEKLRSAEADGARPGAVFQEADLKHMGVQPFLTPA